MDSRDVRGNGHLPPTEALVSFEASAELIQPAGNALPDEDKAASRGAVTAVLSKGFSPVRSLYRIVKADFGKDGHPAGDAAVTTASAGVIAVGLSRLPTVMVPKVTAEIIQHTHSAVEVAAATGAMVGAWCFTSGQTLNEGISRYPTGVAAVKAKIAAVAGLFSSNSPPVLETTAAETDNVRRRSVAAHIGSTLSAHGRRGVKTIAIGVAPYVGMAHVKGVPKPAIRRLVAKSAVDSGAITALVTGSVAEAVIKLDHSDPALAHGIQHGLADTKLWWIAAGSLTIGEGANKLRGRRKANRSMRAAETSQPGSSIGEAYMDDDRYSSAELRLRAKLEQELGSY